MLRRWIFADQLGPHFLDDPHQPVLLVESKAVFRRRAFHRQRAHLLLSALRHRAAELNDQAIHLRTETFREALRQLDDPVEVCHPTSRRARDLVRSLAGVTMLAPRGFVTSPADFADWADRRRGTLRIEDFYRHARQQHGVLTGGTEPVSSGQKWHLDARNRQRPARDSAQLDIPPPPIPQEDEIDAEVRHELDRWAAEGIRFIGHDGPRLFPATRAEAIVRLRHFIRHRLPMFGPYEDAMLSADPFMAHSALSSSFNLGLLDPMEAIREAEQAYRDGVAPLSSVEGFIRQLLGWRDFVWNLYWYFNAGHRADDRPHGRSVPGWFTNLDADAVRARCLSDILAGVRDRAWVHHTPRLMVLANYAVQRGWHPSDLVDWFHRCFIDGTEWALTVNLAGTSQYADPGKMVTKPYAADGEYIKRMSDYCASCRYDPKLGLGGDACPFTAGYWMFVDRDQARLHGNVRMLRSVRQLERRADVSAMAAQEKERGSRAP
ncbi:cryptochrome/photolyase family protein [Micromonospora polyrhachis]|uniref:Deoxyribodipyrimidine photolyase-related protein n=1 Tax=Micromonospora polyrhachis TaxID=1282883 RepID=A0A7W7STJ1_9ACTN|nr:cryptochrome/photolyase family protein [Micromonospora polyrhachis]MBB4960576.1 deoxyribodipyrimidine photolyase-related protein [Micromonospora polyrhachis]